MACFGFEKGFLEELFEGVFTTLTATRYAIEAVIFLGDSIVKQMALLIKWLYLFEKRGSL